MEDENKCSTESRTTATQISAMPQRILTVLHGERTKILN